jgi:hypothetical protein
VPHQDGFPTRQYSYPRPARLGLAGTEPRQLAPGSVYRFLLGKDSEPRSLEPENIKTEFHDPFAALVLANGKPPPVTLRSLLAALDAHNGDAVGLPAQNSFVVADGGQIPWSPQTATLQRQLRFVITRAKQPGTPAELFISTSRALDSPTTFLQVIGWDPISTAYRFYDRRDGAWVFAGSSWDALIPPTRGKGPFDSHVNGALNMKELKIPWQNWHSEAAGIKDEMLDPADPLRAEKLWTARSPAQELERTFIRPGIVRWMEARFTACMDGGRLTRLPEFMRHILETTTVNLTSSVAENGQLPGLDRFNLPLTFCFNSDGLLNTLGLEPDIRVPEVAASLYRQCLERFQVAVTDGTFRFPGDTHFVFVVPEPAFEDLTVLESLLSASVISRKLAACLLMVDFSNPVFSRRRAGLMKYVAPSAPTGQGDLPEFVAAVERAAAALPPDSPEGEFLTNWRLSDDEWQRAFERRLEEFMANVGAQLNSATAFPDIFRLAESRRREFRRRPLAEFRLTTPVTNLPETAPLLELTADGRVLEKTWQEGGSR